MRWKSHVQCEVGENLEITSNSYLSRWYQLAKKKKLKGARCVAYVAGYTAINSINPFKVIKKAAKKTYRGYLKAKCKITKKGCFVEGTLVLTEDGLVPIEDIEVGNYVWAENPDTGDITLKEVLDTFEKKVDTIVTITIDGEKIQTTEAHLFYVEGTGWIPASMLQEGDILSLEDGREVPVQSIETNTYNHYVNVYNFEVDDFHTYYVSDVSVLVHNRTPCQKLKRIDTKNKYWNKKAKYDGSTIYQRDDLIDINLIDKRGRTNLQRMKKGIAPLDKDGNSINLHHLIQMNEGTLAEVSASLHSSKTGILHINGNKIQSGINRKEFANYTKRYWRRIAKDFY